MGFRLSGMAIVATAFAIVSAHDVGAHSTTARNAGGQGSTASPIPDRFVNLQVLPKDISKQDLVNIMKQLSITFEIRCSHCHTVSDDLKVGTFDSDDKEVKKKTRELLKMIYDSKR